LLSYNPASIRIYSRDEVKHHKVSELFGSDLRLRHCIGDVRDFSRLRKACEGVDYVIHAAALKRLDLIEYNVEESVKTNILGTLNVVNACLETGVSRAVFVSTDKACSPVNTYGACKFVGERIFTESNFSKGSKPTVFSCVRYGNVLESTGSVIPLFLKKIKENKPIPLTCSKMTRFIITPDEAVSLVFNAFLYSIGGEVFVPKLPAFRIVDLIEVLKSMNNSDVPTINIGLRPGEKIHEHMISSTEISMTYPFEEMYVITSCIAKYLDGAKAEYLNSEALTTDVMQEYSSGDEIKDVSELRKILTGLGII